MIEFWNIEKGLYKVYTNSIDVKNTFLQNGLLICNTYFDPCDGNGWDFLVESKQLKEVVKLGHKLLKKLQKEEKV